MQQYDKIKQYTYSVCEQIRWKKAHSVISDEITNHIVDQKNAFIAEGFDEAASTDKAIEEMGDPVIVGSQFDRTHRPKTEWSIIILTVSALLVGQFINFFVKSNIPEIPELYFFYRNISTTIVGIICMIAVYFIDFSIIGKYPKILLSMLVVSIIVMGIFTFPINGARRWIEAPFGITIYVPTFILLFPTLYAGIIYSMRNKGYLGIILCGVFFVVPAAAMLVATNGASIMFLCALICITLLLFSICKGYFNVKRLYGILVVIVPTFVFIYKFLITSYRFSRIATFLNPESDPYGAGYIMVQIKNAIGGAKFFGQGTLPYTGDISTHLSYTNTDYVITYLIHRVGWVSFAAILLLLFGFVARGFYLCFKQKSVLGRIVSASVLFTLTLQMFIYILANLGHYSFSQNSLPFITYGGTTNVINLVLVGILLSVFKSGDLISDSQKISANGNYNRKLFELVDGKLIIDLRIRQ